LRRARASASQTSNDQEDRHDQPARVEDRQDQTRDGQQAPKADDDHSPAISHQRRVRRAEKADAVGAVSQRAFATIVDAVMVARPGPRSAAQPGKAGRPGRAPCADRRPSAATFRSRAQARPLRRNEAPFRPSPGPLRPVPLAAARHVAEGTRGKALRRRSRSRRRRSARRAYPVGSHSRPCTIGDGALASGERFNANPSTAR
jgi:hypothetical protein